MNTQITIFDQELNVVAHDFKTGSPKNIESLKGQNKKVYDYMNEFGTINMLQAHSIGVWHLHSRISDLRNKNKINVFDRQVRIGGIDMKDYSLKEFTTE